MTNQLITYRLPIDYSLISLMSSISYVWRNTVNNLSSPNTVSQNDEKPHTAELDDTAIPHVKIKITEIPHEKKPNTAIP